MKPFDLEAAKRGEPIQVNFYDEKGRYTWTDVHFVGTTQESQIMIQFGNGCCSIKDADQLRMRPCKRRFFVNLYRDAESCTYIAGAVGDSKSEVEGRAGNVWNGRGIPAQYIGAFQVEIEE